MKATAQTVTAVTQTRKLGADPELAFVQLNKLKIYNRLQPTIQAIYRWIVVDFFNRSALLY
jgi:hypothetical protein